MTLDFMSALPTSPRQAFFESFASIAVEAVQRPFSQPSNIKSRSPPLVMLTGGLRTRSQFTSVLARKHAHLLGVARLATLQPQLPQRRDEAAIGAGADEAVHVAAGGEQMTAEIAADEAVGAGDAHPRSGCDHGAGWGG